MVAGPMDRAKATMTICAAVAAVGGGCSPARPPFRQVHFCLAGPREVPAFVSVMRSLAQSHGMEFTDRSVDTEAELRSLPNVSFPIAHPFVNISADHVGDVSFGAGNAGLPTRQMTIGFNGRDPKAARKFANATVARLSRRWRIYEVPNHRGAAPLSNCV